MLSEATIQNQTRRDFSYIGPNWRNNVGVLQDINGRPVRFGLGNDSAKLNKEIKSSDLIAITPVVITPAHVGQTLGVFTAMETKKSDWIFSWKDERAVAQWRFHEIVRQHGGYAGFINDPRQIPYIIGRA